MQTTAATFLALLMIFGATPISVSGQEGEGTGFPEKFKRSRHSIEGVWQTTVTQRNCQTGSVIRTFRGLSTYHQGGTLSETSNGLSPALRSPKQMGVWEKESRSNFSSSFIFQFYNPDGSLAGTQKITSNIELSGRNGSRYETTTSIQVFDLNNNLLGTGCATASATRFE